MDCFVNIKGPQNKLTNRQTYLKIFCLPMIFLCIFAWWEPGCSAMCHAVIILYAYTKLLGVWIVKTDQWFNDCTGAILFSSIHFAGCEGGASTGVHVQWRPLGVSRCFKCQSSSHRWSIKSNDDSKVLSQLIISRSLKIQHLYLCRFLTCGWQAGLQLNRRCFTGAKPDRLDIGVLHSDLLPPISRGDESPTCGIEHRTLLKFQSKKIR